MPAHSRRLHVKGTSDAASPCESPAGREPIRDHNCSGRGDTKPKHSRGNPDREKNSDFRKFWEVKL